MCSIENAIDWIRSRVLWCRNRPLSQLCHNYFQCWSNINSKITDFSVRFILSYDKQVCPKKYDSGCNNQENNDNESRPDQRQCCRRRRRRWRCYWRRWRWRRRRARQKSRHYVELLAASVGHLFHDPWHRSPRFRRRRVPVPLQGSIL